MKKKEKTNKRNNNANSGQCFTLFEPTYCGKHSRKEQKQRYKNIKHDEPP